MLGLGILLLRRWVPESPRWLMLHGRLDEADAVIAEIERRAVGDRTAAPAETASGPAARRRCRTSATVRMIRAILRDYPRRVVLGLSLMAAQAFFYNAIFFSYALVLTRFYDGAGGSRSAGTCCRSRSAISSARCCSGRCSTRSGASR